jgi:hypothetical protein
MYQLKYNKSIFLIVLLTLTNTIMGMEQFTGDPVVTCSTCLNDFRRSQFQTLSCGHAFCSECLKEVVTLTLKEQAMRHFCCPDSLCKKRITLSDATNLGVSEENKDQLREILNPKRAGGQDFSTRVWMFFNTQSCPKCEIPIERISGCDHMACDKCGHNFCWRCLKPRSGYFNHDCPIIPNRILFRVAAGALVGYGVYKLYNRYTKKETNKKFWF